MDLKELRDKIKMSETNVLKLDINSLTDFQKDLYEAGPDESLETRFACDVEKISWSTRTKRRMTTHTVQDDEGEVVYMASKKYDSLLSTELHINLIHIKVKDKYKKRVQICYPHNPGHNIAYRGEVKIDDDHHQTIDSVWMDEYSQYFMNQGPGHRDLYNRMVGNIPCLTNWNTELPRLKLVVPQPYHYSRNTRVCIRTLQSQVNITHHYKIRHKLKDILRMRVLKPDTDEYVEIPCNPKYLDVPGNFRELPIPELWATYGLMTDEEREWHKSVDPRTGERIKHIIYTEDIFMVSSDNPRPLGSVDVIPLQCKAPCKALFCVAQDVDFVKVNNFSNYTTNGDDLYEGWNPISRIGLKYGGVSKLDDLSHEHFEFSEARHFPSAPADPGYNAFPIGYNQTTLNSDVALVFEPLGASLHIKLDNTDPFENIEDLDENIEDDDSDIIPTEALEESTMMSKNKYIVHVRGLVYKKLIFNWDDKAKTFKYSLLEDATNK